MTDVMEDAPQDAPEASDEALQNAALEAPKPPVDENQACSVPAAFPYSIDEVREELARVKRLRRRNIVIAVLAGLIVCAALIAVITIGTSDSFRTVSDDSMNPVLEQGQVVHVDRTFDLEADEIAVYLDTSGTVRFGRVIALPGEWVNAMSDGTVVVSEASLSDAAAADEQSGANALVVGSRQVPTGGYCVIGDADNAAEKILAGTDAFIRKGQVIGRAEWVAWPIWSARHVG